MNRSSPQQESTYQLKEAARASHAPAAALGRPTTVADVLESVEEALQVLSGRWYQLAADASSVIVERPGDGADGRARPGADGLGRDDEIRLMDALDDVAAAFARCARACRDARTTVTPVARRMADDDRPSSIRFPRFKRDGRPNAGFA
jgi:hypothetical protein